MNISRKFVEAIVDGRPGSVPLMYRVVSGRGFETPLCRNRWTGTMPMGRCFRNADLLVKRYPELIYCEGFATAKEHGVPLEHAWVLTPDGELIDPTWSVPADYYGCAFRRQGHLKIQSITGYIGVFGNLHMLRMNPSAVLGLLHDATYDPRELPV